MKSIKKQVLILGLALISCNSAVTNKTPSDQVISDSAKGDSVKVKKFVKALVTDNDTTINFVDNKGKKQGHWIVKNSDNRLPGFAPEAKIEEGSYKDGKKEGEWIEYNADGSIRSRVIFKDDRPVRLILLPLKVALF